jgi:thiazole synthase ThiGH ThiG subunit
MPGIAWGDRGLAVLDAAIAAECSEMQIRKLMAIAREADPVVMGELMRRRITVGRAAKRLGVYQRNAGV